MVPPTQPDLSGLTEDQAIALLKEHGFNELPSGKKPSILTMIINILKEPMLFLLLASGSIYFLIGETQDALMLVSCIFVIIGITLYQEQKTEKALSALKELANPKATVIRGGMWKQIDSRELAVGDTIVVIEGERIPADAVIVLTTHLMVDESLLTGESIPVRKSNWDGIATYTHPGGEDTPFIFSGTLVTQGKAYARITKTGSSTEIGKIGSSLSSIQEEETQLKKETARIVKSFSLIGLALCLLVIGLYVILKGNIIQGILSGLTLAMSMLPEEFPVVLLIFLTLGAWRISKRKVLTRKTAAIETLGAATVLCVDKTGTITENRMRLDELWTSGSSFSFLSESQGLPEQFHALCEYAYLASHNDPFDPIEQGIQERMNMYLKNSEHIHKNWNLIQEYPLTKNVLSLSHVWDSPDKTSHVIAAKGAPEAIGDLCHLSKSDHSHMMEKVLSMSQRGLRVLGVAKAEYPDTTLPKNQHDYDFSFIGLIGFTDPIRKGVKESVLECYNAGIRVVLITGDYPGTAQYIARAIGLKNPETVITGSELEAMKPPELPLKIRNVNIFARVVPEQKLLIVNGLKANGEIVAMTGDGVNDAPALKAAHIGIAMGERGTDVAREASDLVLMNDDFSSIVRATRLGRRIFDNIKKAISFILSVHIPIAGMSLLPVLFDLPPVLLPAHIAFLELIIDPACSVVFEAEKEEHTVMHRPPRDLSQPLINPKSVSFSSVQGGSILIAVFSVFLYALKVGFGNDTARTLAFTTLVCGNLFLIVTNLSHSASWITILKEKNMSLYVILGSAFTFLIFILQVPFLRSLFDFSSITPIQLLGCLTIAFICLMWFEGLKYIQSKTTHHM